MRKIDELTAFAYQTALENVVVIINRKFHTNFTVKNDWDAVEDICREFDIQFDENGEIIR